MKNNKNAFELIKVLGLGIGILVLITIVAYYIISLYGWIPFIATTILIDLRRILFRFWKDKANRILEVHKMNSHKPTDDDLTT